MYQVSCIMHHVFWIVCRVLCFIRHASCVTYVSCVMYHVRITCQIQNPDIPLAGRGRAAHGRAAGRSGAGQVGTPTGRFAQEIAVPLVFQGFQGIEHNFCGRFVGSTNKRIPM